MTDLLQLTPQTPESPDDIALQIQGAALAPVAGRPWIAAVGDVPDAMSATLVSYPDRTVLAELPQVSHKWEDVQSGYGSATVTIDAAEPAVALLDEGQLILHRLYGRLAIVTIVEEWSIAEIQDKEEAGELCTIAGRSHLANLELGLVYPLIFGPGPTGQVILDRVFNWASIDFPDDSWAAATELQRQGDNTETPPFFVDGNFGPHPRGWPEPDAYWIWSRPFDGDPGADTATMPVGTCYFRKHFTLAEPKQIRVYIGTDDFWEAWIDGSKLDESDAYPAEAWSVTQYVDLSLPAGDHVFAVRAINYQRLSPIGNVAGLIAAAYTIAQNTKLPEDLVFLTDDSWLSLDYPEGSPGFTPGQVLRIVLDEAAARGTLTEVTRSFDDEVDSNGQPWDTVTEIATRVGTDMGTFVVGELGATYIDVRMEPGDYVLDAYLYGTGGDETDIDLDPAPDYGDPRQGALTFLARRYG